MTRYVEPGWFTRNVFNRAVRRLTLLGLPVAGSRELRVRGRSSGQWRSTPVNVLTVEGRRYLVSPRGNTQWVRNARVDPGVELRVGRRVERARAVELSDDRKTPVLRHYVTRWGWEIGQFFDDVDKHSTDDQLAAVAPGFPVFELLAP